MPGHRVTSWDVARLAGVSRSTVSLVLNDVRTVSIREETRMRVLAAARELRYVPHAAGRALATQRTRNIGLLHSSFDSTHGLLLEVIRGMTRVTGRYEHLLLVDTLPDHDDAEPLLALTRAKHIDGVVMFESRTADPVLRAVAADGFPVVLIGTLADERLCTVDMDTRAAAAALTSHLIDLGHRRIACITHVSVDHTEARNRLDGFYDALAAAGIPTDAVVVRHADAEPQSGYDAMADVLSGGGEPPTAVFVTNDTVAFGAMSCIHRHGLRIPADIAVAGFDDIPLSRFACPPLTTVRFSAEEEGRRAAEILLRLIEGEVEPGYREEIEAEIVIRESTVGPVTDRSE